MREVIYKIIFDGVVDDYIRKQIDECDFMDVFSGSDSNSEIGVTYYTKLFNLFDLEVIAQVWALNQSNQFNSLKPMYYKGAKLIIFVMLNNSSSVTQILDYSEQSGILPNQIVLVENTKAFTKTFFEFTIVLTLYNDNIIGDSEYKEHQSVCKKGNNPKFKIADSLLNSET